MLSIEELLEPRYKVIADYPGAFAIVGSVWDEEESAHYILHHEELNADKYPHLFKKLEWWEERDEKDMPRYVRIKSECLKVNKWIISIKYGFTFKAKGSSLNYLLKNVYPATREEYEQYISQQTNKK